MSQNYLHTLKKDIDEYENVTVDRLPRNSTCQDTESLLIVSSKLHILRHLILLYDVYTGFFSGVILIYVPSLLTITPLPSLRSSNVPIYPTNLI